MNGNHQMQNGIVNSSTKEKNIMEVEGIGRLPVSPDQALITIGVKNEDQNIQVAQRENAVRSKVVIDALKALGIDESDIQTTDYTINVRYDYQDGQQIFRGYDVSHILEITVNQLEALGYVIDTAVTNGANFIQNIQFTLKNPDDYYQQALQLAMEDAKDKANVIAETFSADLHPMPVKITEKKEQQIVPYTRVLSATSYSTSETPIQSGQLSVEAKVIILFTFK